MATNPLQPVYSRVDEYNLFQNLMNVLGNATFFGNGLPTVNPNVLIIDTQLYKWYINSLTGDIYHYLNGGWGSSLGKLGGGNTTPGAAIVPQTLGYNQSTGVLTLSNNGGSVTISPPLQGPQGAPGNTGPTGGTGLTGQQGTPGLNGNRFTVQSILPTPLPIGQIGDLVLYLNNSDSANNGNIYQNQAGVEIKVGNIQGPGTTSTGSGANTLTILNPNNFNLSGITVSYLGSGNTILATQALPATGTYNYLYPIGTINVSYTLNTNSTSTNAQINTTVKSLQNLVRGIQLPFYTIGGALTDTVNAFSYNTPPISLPGSNQTITIPTNSINLVGSGTCTVSGGSITNYLWSQISGPNTAFTPSYTTSTLVLSRMNVGSYVYQLIVTDSFGLTASNNVTITVANATGGQTAVLSQTVIVTAAQSGPTITIQPNSSLASGTTTSPLIGTVTINTTTNIAVISTKWTQVSGPNIGTLVNIGNTSTSVSNLIVGTYVFQFTGLDTLGNISFLQTTVKINLPAVAPIVNAGVNQTLAINVSTCVLTATATESDGSSITSTLWTVTGPNNPTVSNASALTTNVSGLIAGTYTFVFTANSSNGLHSSVSTSIIASQSAAPTVSAGTNQTLGAGASTGTLVGTATGNGGATIVSTLWTKLSGPASGVITTPSSLTTGLTGLGNGTYVYQLSATDSLGVNSTSSVNIIAAAVAAVTYTTNLNFNGTAQNIAGWLDITSATGPNIGLYTGAIGNSVGLSSVATANWPWNNNASSGAGNVAYTGSSTIVPIAVGNSGWFTANTGVYDKTITGALLLFTGCVVGATYSMQIYNSIDASYQPSDNFYLSVNGGADQQPNATANANTLITFSGLVPDASGRLWVSAGFTLAGKYPIINAIIFSRTA